MVCFQRKKNLNVKIREFLERIWGVRQAPGFSTCLLVPLPGGGKIHPLLWLVEKGLEPLGWEEMAATRRVEQCSLSTMEALAIAEPSICLQLCFFSGAFPLHARSLPFFLMSGTDTALPRWSQLLGTPVAVVGLAALLDQSCWAPCSVGGGTGPRLPSKTN